MTTQRLATFFNGMTRHSPEGINFNTRAGKPGSKQGLREPDTDRFVRTLNRPINAPK